MMSNNEKINKVLIVAIVENVDKIAQIRDEAYHLHDVEANQHYGEYPYSKHLRMVYDNAVSYLSLVCTKTDDVVPVLFGALFHDSIEDARMTYNDVKKIALKYMPEDSATLATEIVYALTNEKGRNRNERANDKYYEGIRTTPYASYIKMCDRFANIQFSTSEGGKPHMKDVYKKEWNHFIDAIIDKEKAAEDIRFSVPQEMIDDAYNLINN